MLQEAVRAAGWDSFFSACCTETLRRKDDNSGRLGGCHGDVTKLFVLICADRIVGGKKSFGADAEAADQCLSVTLAAKDCAIVFPLRSTKMSVAAS